MVIYAHTVVVGVLPWNQTQSLVDIKKPILLLSKIEKEFQTGLRLFLNTLRAGKRESKLGTRCHIDGYLLLTMVVVLWNSASWVGRFSRTGKKAVS